MKRFNIFIIVFSILVCINQAVAQIPNIDNVNKISGTYAEVVTISGSGFSDNKANLNVFFGGSKGKIVSSTEYLIEVLVPSGATYNNISVTNLISNLTGYAKDYFNLAFKGTQYEFDEARIIQSHNIQEDDELFDLCNCDFNGDGLNDLAATNNADEVGNTSISVYQNITQSSEFEISFQKIYEPNLTIGKGARNITCADLNGDGKPELIVGKGGGSSERFYIFRNISTTAIRFDTPLTVLLSESATSSSARRLKIQDMDTDGKPDIIMTDQGTGKVFIWRNESSATSISFPYSSRQSIQMDATSLIGLDVADLNNDGKPEIVCNSATSDIFILPNESIAGSIKMGSPQSISNVGSRLVNLKIGDLDHDGDKDIAITNLENNIFILVNNGNNDSFSFGTPKYVGTGRAPWGLDFGDLNGDGLVDIVVTTTDASEKLTALINKSNGSNLIYIPYQIGKTDVSFNVNIADFNGDGKPDIAYNDRAKNELIFLRNTHCVIPDIRPANPPAICVAKQIGRAHV